MYYYALVSNDIEGRQLYDMLKSLGFRSGYRNQYISGTVSLLINRELNPVNIYQDDSTAHYHDGDFTNLGKQGLIKYAIRHRPR